MIMASTDPTAENTALTGFAATVAAGEFGPRNTWDKTLTAEETFIEDARKRRRISPRKVTTGYRFLRGERLIGGLDSGMTTLVSHQARLATERRQLSRQYLSASDVPLLPARTFHVSQTRAAENYIASRSVPLVVGPASTRIRSHTTVTVSDTDTFSEAWTKAVDACGRRKPMQMFVDLEEFRPNLLVRAFVVGETVVAAAVLLPFFVNGDGKRTLKELVQDELRDRKRCSYLGARLPGDAALTPGISASWKTVPAAGKSVFLSLVPDAQAGGITVDVTDRISAELTSLAVDAMWAFPGLSATAIDILTPSLSSAEGALVTGMDARADVTQFQYPTYGSSRRVTLRIFDHMLASTKKRV